MPFNVLEFLRPRKAARAGLLEGLAQRLHAGEQIDPDTVLAQLAEAGATDQQLQTEIDRLERVATLRAKAADGAPAQRRLDAIEAEQEKAQAAFEKAAHALRSLQQKHAPEVEQLQMRLRGAEQATDALTAADNLAPGTLAQLRALEQASHDVAEQASAARRELEQARARWRDAEEQLPVAEEAAKRLRNCPSTQEAKQRWANAHAARKQQLADAQTAADEAQTREAAAAKAERVFRQQIITGGAG